MSAPYPPGALPEHAQQTLSDIQQKIREQEQDLLGQKRGVNALLAAYKLPPCYTDLDQKPVSMTGPLRRDQFYGQPLSAVVREILTRRRAADLGPASVGEIYDAMVEGGYQFEAKDEENAKRGLRISLTKNSSIFHRLPMGHYGLKEWYPAAKEPKSRIEQPTEANGKTIIGTVTVAEAMQAVAKTGEKQKVAVVTEEDDFDFEKKESTGNEGDIPF